MQKICIVWDFDNTLAYREGLWTKTLGKLLLDNGYENFDEQVISKTLKSGFPWRKAEQAHKEYFGDNSWWEYFNSYVSEAIDKIGVSDAKENSRLTARFRNEYLKIDAWHLFDDTISNLEYSLSKGYDNMILSNHTPELPLLVKKLGLDKYFEIVISSADIGYEKPHKMMFAEIFKYGSYEKYYMIGDNYRADIVGAEKAGLRAILVRHQNLEKYKFYSEDLDGIWKFIA